MLTGFIDCLVVINKSFGKKKICIGLRMLKEWEHGHTCSSTNKFRSQSYTEERLGWQEPTVYAVYI
jgi:hypothetical protein